MLNAGITVFNISVVITIKSKPIR